MAGNVKMAPATTAPEQAPMLCMMTFSPNALERLAAVDTPTAMMAMGMAASNTCPTFSPRYAAAAEKSIAIITPHVTDHAFTSGYSLLGDIMGSYCSPSFNSRKAFSASWLLISSIFSNLFTCLQFPDILHKCVQQKLSALHMAASDNTRQCAPTLHS